MNQEKVALLFPGQGAYYPGVLGQAARTFPSIASVWSEIDAVAERRLKSRVSDAIWSSRPKSIDELVAESPTLLQLAIFGTSVAVYRILQSEGLRPDVLVGHSFGEIAALTCGGALTTSEGADIVCDRTEAARLTASDGYMAALGTNASTAATLVSLLGNHDMVIAGENGATQTVLSGVRAKMDRAADIAKLLNLGFFRLNSPYPFHSPLMEPVKVEFSRRLRHLESRSFDTPVFSPILGRYYEPSDNLGECLAAHLVQPVRFGQAIARLCEDGVGTLVECGALDALTKLARYAAPNAGLSGIACLTGQGDEVDSLKKAVVSLGLPGRTGREENAGPLSAVLPPHLTMSGAGRFWKERGASVRQFVEQEYERYQQGLQGPGATAIPSASPAAMARPRAGQTARPMNREEVFGHLVTMYAVALEYPQEVFTPDVELEAELGVDSVKQTELLARVSERYNLPPRSADFRLSNYNTLGKVADLIVSAVAHPASATPPDPRVEPVNVPSPPRGNPTRREELSSRIVSIYASALEYPEEVFSPDVALEADLGIDSVKQTELLARVSDEFGLPARPADFRLANYDTLGKVTDFVFNALRTNVSAPEIDHVLTTVSGAAMSAASAAAASSAASIH